MAAARAERSAGGEDNALTPIREETENESAKATPARGTKSDGRGRSMSSGKIRMRGAVSGRLLPGEMRPRKSAPPSSVKRLKSKDAVTVAAVVRKPKRSGSSVISGNKRAVQPEQLPPSTEMEAESVDVASNGDRAATRRWPTGSPRPGTPRKAYKCMLLYAFYIQMTLTATGRREPRAQTSASV